MTLIAGFAVSRGCTPFPFVFSLSIASPFMPVIAGFDVSVPSPAIASLTPSKPFNPSSEAMCPLGSTATKLVRTVDRGLELLLVTLPAGDRPREGGEVSSLCCSNLARREATPLGEREDMTANQERR